MAAVLQLHLPLMDKAQFKGDLMAEYSIDALYRYGVPFEITSKYAVSFHDAMGRPLAGTNVSEGSLKRRFLPWATPINAYEIPVSPVGNGLTIRGQVYRTSLGLIGSGLFWLVMLLSGATAWLLLANWRHTRRRIQRAGRAGAGDGVSPRHGELDADRYACTGHAGAHHLRQLGFLRHDRLG
jgi:hypothetical protein